MGIFRHWLLESLLSDIDKGKIPANIARIILGEMAQYPNPGPGWRKMRSKYTDQSGDYPWIWWNPKGPSGKSETRPVYTPDDPRVYDPNDLYNPRELDPNAQRRQSPPPAKTPQRPIQSQTVWYCAMVKGSDQRVVLRPKDPQNMRGVWIYRELDPETRQPCDGELTTQEAADLVQSVTNADGRKKTVTNDMEWLGSNSPATTTPASIPAVAPPQQPATGDNENGNGNGNGNNPGVRPSPEQVRLPPEKMTKYNRNIEDRFTATNENIMIDALAGTGKTTMLKHLSSFIKPGERWLYLVFNKKNQVESQSAFPTGVDVMTTHAFLGRLLKQNGKSVGGSTQLPPRGQKWQKIYQVADQLIPLEWPESIHAYRNRKTGEMQSPFHFKGKRVVTKLASRAKAYALNPADPNIAEMIKQLLVKCADIETDLSTEKYEQDRDYTPDIIEMATELLKLTLPGGIPRHMEQTFSMYRDQDDTLWYAAIYADGINWHTEYNVILLDEVQDFNMCQLVMAKKLKEAGARVVAVGDPNQAMYLFRGADAEAFQKLKEIIGGGDAASLPINFRSGGNIINWVKGNTHVKALQPAPHLEGKGEVYAPGGNLPPVGYQDFMSQIASEWTQGIYKDERGRPINGGRTKEPTCMICRTNAPLAHAALTFLKTGIDFEIVGKDLSTDLTDLIKRVTWQKPEREDIMRFPGTLSAYIEDLEAKWGVAGANKISKADELSEMQAYAEVLTAVLQHLSENDYREQKDGPQLRTAKDLIGYLQRKLGGLDPDNPDDMAKLKAKDPRSFVTLTTAHKSKGLEWDRIFLMKPGEYNPEGKKIKTPEQAQQERNTWYVAATRGRNTLMVSADDEP